jgi:hypothetical protein
MWIPGQVPPGLVEQAVESAWPGARTTILDEDRAPISASGTVEGGRLVPARAAAIPLRTKFDTDPLRPLLGSFAALGHGESACVQILTRPASARRARLLRRTLPALTRTRPGSGVPSLGALLARIAPAPPVGTRTGSTGRSGAPWRDARTDADARAAAGKLAGPLWEAEIRYAATSPVPAGAQGEARGRARARGLAHATASAMNVYAERNHLRRRRLARPIEAVACRGFGRGALYSVAELAALAHLPTDTVIPGLARAGARPVPPSAQIPQHTGAGHVA